MSSPTDARWSVAGGVLALGLLAVLPGVLNGYGIQVVTIGFFYVVLGVSWNLIAGYIGQFSLAQHAFATISAYVSAATVLALHAPVPVGILAGVLAASVLGYALGWLTLGLRGVYFAIATWAFAESIRILLTINYQVTRGDMGLAVPFLFDSADQTPAYEVFLAAAAVSVIMVAVLLRTKLGYRMHAIRDDQELAVAAGIDVVRWKRWVFVLSTALAGLAGALYGHTVGLLSPSQADFSQMAFIVVAVVLGGFRSLWGPVVGALLAQGLAELLRFSAELRLIVFAVLVLVIMRLYPPGVVGLARALASRLEVRLGGGGSGSGSGGGGKSERRRAEPAL